MSPVADDSAEDSDILAQNREGGLNWRAAFNGGMVFGITHVLKCTASKTIMLLAFKILFNMIERPEVFKYKFCLFTRRGVDPGDLHALKYVGGSEYV